MQRPEIFPLWGKANPTCLGLHRICGFYQLVPSKNPERALFYTEKLLVSQVSMSLKPGPLGFCLLTRLCHGDCTMDWFLQRRIKQQPQTPCRQLRPERKGSAPHRSSTYSRAHPLPAAGFDHCEVSTNTEWRRKRMVMFLTWSTLMRNKGYTVLAQRFP